MVAVEKGTFYSGEKGTRKIGVDNTDIESTSSLNKQEESHIWGRFPRSV